jgi:hypothetical protein
MSKKNKDLKSKIKEKINNIYAENEYANLLQNKTRARSVTVGTAFGGVVEISMRGDYSAVWAILQPVEVIELIEQLSASVGVQVAMRPKQDFAAWRGWNVDMEDRHLAGCSPWQIEEMSESKKTLLQPSSTEDQHFISDSEYENMQNEVKKEIREEVSETVDSMRENLTSGTNSIDD